ncbi:MAG: hypothetical protein IPP15_12830 [Saprospiraceae bacterium]|uniref:Uncharacterized protein n=1 Tax=Candidatus Opimibacter skivensis TaxID=2982028 RepID=A0A9D7STZ8_9BACT|nr:hypothetical protein [Candidatus Opimibacter skivensis]
METFVIKLKYSLFFLVTFFSFGLCIPVFSNSISEARTDSLISTIVSEFNRVVKDNEKLAVEGRNDERKYIVRFEVADDFTTTVSLTCDWVEDAGVGLDENTYQSICTQYTAFNNDNLSKVQHYLIYIDFPAVILGTKMIVGQKEAEKHLDYYTKNQNDVNYPAYEAMINTIRSRMNIDNIGFLGNTGDDHQKILTVFGRWYYQRNKEQKLAVSYGTDYYPSNFLTPFVISHFINRINENEANYYGNKWSLINVMQTTMDYFNNFVPPGTTCLALKDEVHFSSAIGFIDNICTTINPAPEYLPYLWSLAKYIDNRQSRHPTNAPIDQGELNFITSLFSGFIAQHDKEWDDYVESQINGNDNINFLGYIIYSLGTGEDFSPQWSSVHLKDLLVEYLAQIHEVGSSNYYVNEHRRNVILNLFNTALQQMEPTDCATLLNEIQSKVSPSDGKRACINTIWDLSNLFWNSGQTDVEVINLINKVAIKASGITRGNVATFIDGANAKKLVYWKFSPNAVANIESISPEDRVDYSYNFLNDDYAKLNLSMKQCTLVTCSTYYDGNSFHNTCNCTNQNFFDYNDQDHRYENLDPFTVLYVVAPTNVSFLNLCSNGSGFCDEGVSPVTALSLALSIEKSQEETTEENLVLAGTIISTVLTFGEAYPVLAVGGKLAKIYAGFNVANEAVFSNMQTDNIYNTLTGPDYHVDPGTAGTIKTILDKVKIIGLAVDMAMLDPGDFLTVEDAAKLGVLNKVAQYETKALDAANDITDIQNLIEVSLDVENVATKKVSDLTTLQKSITRDVLGIQNVPNANLSEELVELISRSKGLDHNFGPDINSLSTADQLLLLNSIENNTDFIKDLAELPNGIKAWKLIKNFPQRRTDINLLRKMDEVMADGTILNRLGGETGLQDIIIKNVQAPCCGLSHPWLKSIDEYLDDVKGFATEFGSPPPSTGFDVVIDGMKSNNAWTVQSVAQMLKKIKNEPSLFTKSNVASFDNTFASMAEEELDLACGNCRFDMAMNDDSKFEFKSYKETSVNLLPNSSGFKNQHRAYIEAGPVNKTNYIFESGKIPNNVTVNINGTNEVLTRDQYIRHRFLEMYKNDPGYFWNGGSTSVYWQSVSPTIVSQSTLTSFLNSQDYNSTFLNFIKSE